MSSNPLTIILVILTFVGAVGTLSYKKKYEECKKRYYDFLIPKPSTKTYKSESTLKREEYEKIRSQILLRDHFRCQECGYYKHLEVHHIIPRSKGGSDEPDNLITLCQRCHAKKHGFKRRENKRVRHARRNRRKREKRWLNKNKKKLIKEPFVEDFHPHHPREASPSRRKQLFEKWENDELNQRHER